MAKEDFDEIMHLQRQMASRVVQENEMELQAKLLEIMTSLVKGRDRTISTAQILTVAEMDGVPENEAVRILKTLEDLSYVKRRGSSYTIV